MEEQLKEAGKTGTAESIKAEKNQKTTRKQKVKIKKNRKKALSGTNRKEPLILSL